MSAAQRNAVNVIGSGRQTIVLAHGFGSNQTAWRQQVDALKADYRLVLFDHVGSGRSDLAAFSPYRYAGLFGFAEDLLEICQELKLRRVHFVGHSVSGMVGLLAAQIDPTLFARVVLVGASPRYLNDGAYLGGFEQADLDALFAAMADDYHAWASGFAPAAMGNPDKPDLVHEFQRTLSSMRPDIALQIARAIFQSDHRADLPSLKLPTLILQSKSDIAVPVAVGEYMHRQIAGSSYQLLDATGHFPHMSAPHQVTQAIRNFLQG